MEQNNANANLVRLEKERKRVEDRVERAKNKKQKLHALDKALDGNTQHGTIVPSDVVETAHPDLLAEAEIIFQPNPGPQTYFFEASERELLYGGAAGGGKSYALIVDAVRDAWHPQHRAILFRRTLDELRELISKSKELYPQMYPGCRWNKQESTWAFPSGATVWYTYLESEDDVHRYQGQAFNYIGFDELTQWATPFNWDYLRSRLRTTAPDLRLYMRATSNPGGIGSHWVKKMFIDPAQWGEAFWATDIETGQVLVWPDLTVDGKPHHNAGKPLFKRRFIPAKLSDNPYYANGDYEANLLSLPESQRKQLLEGNWDVVQGAGFPEFNRSVHVVQPFTIPDGWVRFRACDYGYSSYACCLWMTMDNDGRIYVYRELYVRQEDGEEFGKHILALEANERVRGGVLDGSVWSKRGETGPSIAELMNKMGCRWRPSDRSPGSRENGKLEVHRRLKMGLPYNVQTDDGRVVAVPGKPMLQIFNTCHNLIRTLPILPVDKTNPEDINTDAEDHAYDALRYGLQSRPMKPTFDMGLPKVARISAQGPRVADSAFGY